MNPPLRVLIADDHPVYRRGLTLVLSSAERFEVAGEASRGDEAVAAVGVVRPDVVVMDINMPGVNGIEATRQIAAAHPEARILILTMFEDDDSVFAALRAGALGYVLKGAAESEICHAIECVAEGQAVFGPAIARRVVKYFSSITAAGRPAGFRGLTARECEVLDLIAQGLNNARIAHRLFVTEKTVRNYVSAIFAKMQVVDRAAAIVQAREAGFGGAGGDSPPA